MSFEVAWLQLPCVSGAVPGPVSVFRVARLLYLCQGGDRSK